MPWIWDSNKKNQAKCCNISVESYNLNKTDNFNILDVKPEEVGIQLYSKPPDVTEGTMLTNFMWTMININNYIVKS